MTVSFIDGKTRSLYNDSSLHCDLKKNLVLSYKRFIDPQQSDLYV